MAKKETNKSALTEQEGVISSEITNAEAVSKLKAKRKSKRDTQDLINSLLDGNITALSQAITIIESKHTKHQEQAHQIVKACLPHANKSVRIGITGVPGVGKSTFLKYLLTVFYEDCNDEK